MWGGLWSDDSVSKERVRNGMPHGKTIHTPYVSRSAVVIDFERALGEAEKKGGREGAI